MIYTDKQFKAVVDECAAWVDAALNTERLIEVVDIDNPTSKIMKVLILIAALCGGLTIISQVVIYWRG